jgi:hypothetical protein
LRKSQICEILSLYPLLGLIETHIARPEGKEVEAEDVEAGGAR